MFRAVVVGLAIAICCGMPALGEADPTSLEGYFTGKTVVAKIDMPGTEKGIDLDFEKPTPLDWKSYSSRLNDFGIAIHRGDLVRVTKIALKSDHIEFQLNGGGYGTFGEDTSTKVNAKDVDKSKYEKDLEKQLDQTKDPKAKLDIQTQLDRERERRERQQQINRDEAEAASRVKAQQLAERRMRGGSRFNLNFKKTVPSDDRSPDAVMKLLAEYLDFDTTHSNGAGAVAPAGAVDPTLVRRAPYTGVGAAGVMQLKRGMKMEDVTALLGQGNSTAQSVSSEGLKTQVMEYQTEDSVADVTYVEGLVVRYSINSK